MSKEKKALIIDEHLKIENAFMLKDYLVKKLTNKYGFNPFEITACDEDSLHGYVHNVSFAISYSPGKTCTLVVDEDWEVVLTELQKYISPVMWRIDKDAENAVKSAHPIISYKLPMGVSVVEWDNFNPIQKLLMFVRPYFDKSVIPTDVKILYPITEQELKEKLKYGEYKYAFDKDSRDIVQNFTEEQTFAHLRSFNNESNKILAKGELEPEDYYNIDSLRYCANYLMQHTKNFGIKVNNPSLEPVKPTAQFIAWYLAIEKICDLTTRNENVSFEALEKENLQEYNEIASYFIDKNEWMKNNIEANIPVAEKLIKEAEQKGFSETLNIFFIPKENTDELNQ